MISGVTKKYKKIYGPDFRNLNGLRVKVVGTEPNVRGEIQIQFDNKVQLKGKTIGKRTWISADILTVL